MFGLEVCRNRTDFPENLDWADRIFDDLAAAGLLGEVTPAFLRGEGEIVPAFDISETEHHIKVRADLPGVDAGKLDISLTGNVLTIRGEKTLEKSEEKESCRCSERRFGSFSRSFTLPTDVSGEGVDASYKDGVLLVSIPKSATAKHKKIDVKTG